MGRSGPVPESNKVRRLKGLPARDVPQAVPAVPECPVWLEGDARDMWEHVTPELERLELLGRIDLAVLAGYCQCWAMWRKHEGDLAESPYTEGSMGQVVRHPAHDMALARLKELRQLAVQLGLTPASRQRIVRAESSDVEGDAVFGRG